jgi:hypothetical protein
VQKILKKISEHGRLFKTTMKLLGCFILLCFLIFVALIIGSKLHLNTYKMSMADVLEGDFGTLPKRD